MTKKDFERIACDIAVAMNNCECDRLLAEQHEDAAERDAQKRKANYGAMQVERLAYSLAATFRIDNPRFDTNRFLRACGVAQ
jgi:hypothetical protein